MYKLLENNAEMNIENVVIKQAHQIEKKNKIRSIRTRWMFERIVKNWKAKDFQSLRTFLESQMIFAEKGKKVGFNLV